jgi:hypothetical protein
MDDLKQRLETTLEVFGRAWGGNEMLDEMADGARQFAAVLACQADLFQQNTDAQAWAAGCFERGRVMVAK